MMREFTVTPKMAIELGPDGVMRQMKEQGFRFVSETCPIKLADHYSIEGFEGGIVVYKQWEQ